MFNEELSFDERRIFFTDHTLKHIKVFNAMFNLHGKDKENLDKIDNFIKHSNEALERQTFYYDKLRKLTFEKYLIQKKTNFSRCFFHDYFFGICNIF